MTDTQSQAILAYLETGAAITPLEALHKFGCFRLGARIWDLKAAGWEIETTMIKVGEKRVAQYKLKTERERAHRAFSYSDTYTGICPTCGDRHGQCPHTSSYVQP